MGSYRSQSSPPSLFDFALHAGTVATPLSAPFSAAGLEIHPPTAATRHLPDVIDQLTAGDSGGFFDWRGQPVAW